MARCNYYCDENGGGRGEGIMRRDCRVPDLGFGSHEPGPVAKRSALIYEKIIVSNIVLYNRNRPRPMGACDRKSTNPRLNIT